jgi:hypothetical protein
MKKIAFAFIAAMAVLSFGGCKKKGDDAAAKMEGFKTEMCACKDKACADAVQKKVTDWSNAQPKPKEGEKPKADPKMEATMKAYTECMMKHMAPPTPPTPDPAATPPAAPPAGTDPAATPPAAGGDDMKKDDMKKDEAKPDDMKKDDMKKDDMKK